MKLSSTIKTGAPPAEIVCKVVTATLTAVFLYAFQHHKNNNSSELTLNPKRNCIDISLISRSSRSNLGIGV